MHSTEHPVATLPRGSWLAQERRRLGKTRAEVAKAVGGHSATLRSIEHSNRVVPPGWYPELRTLGMQIPEPVWPLMQPYCGTDLQRDIRTRAGFPHSRFCLSKRLAVPESAVTEVVRGNLPVPHSWLLKLAELGAGVPAPVRRTLDPTGSGALASAEAAPLGSEWQLPRTLSSRDAGLSSEALDPIFGAGTRRFPDGLNPGFPSPFPSLGQRNAQEPLLRPVESKGYAPRGTSSRSAESAPPPRPEFPIPGAGFSPPPAKPAVEAPGSASGLRERPSAYVCWTAEEGLLFGISTQLLEQLPVVLKDLLILLHQSGLLSPARDQAAPASGA